MSPPQLDCLAWCSRGVRGIRLVSRVFMTGKWRGEVKCPKECLDHKGCPWPRTPFVLPSVKRVCTATDTLFMVKHEKAGPEVFPGSGKNLGGKVVYGDAHPFS